MAQTDNNPNDYCGLETFLVDTLKSQSVFDLFPVQKLVLPTLLEGIKPAILPPRDICISAPTGSGKTLCYVLPIVQALKFRRLRRIRALIVVPVVNLAKQVFDVFNVYVKNTDLKVVLLTGKQNFQKEMDALYETDRNGRTVATCDIIVSTPGRLLDHLWSNEEEFSLKFLRFLVLDEADRLMNDFKLDWLNEVEYSVYTNKADDELKRFRVGSCTINELLASGRFPLQKFLLSATLSHNPEQLKELNLFLPQYFNVDTDGRLREFDLSENSVGVPQELKEFYVKCEQKWKPLTVYLLMKQYNWKKVLCFVSKREASSRLAFVLQKLNMPNVKDVTAKINKFRMERIFKQFKTNENGVLICTDLMARGMDFDSIDCVLNYNVPKFIRTYVHRVGRTARAGSSGVAFTLADDKELKLFENVLNQTNHFVKLKSVEIASEQIELHQDAYKSALNELKEESGKRKTNRRKYRKSNNFGKKKRDKSSVAK